MQLVINTEICKKSGKDADVILYLFSLLSGCRITPLTFEKARQQGFLKFEQMYDRRFPFPDYVSLSDTGKYVAESILAQSATKSSEDTETDRFIVLANKMRECFPEGYKKGSDSHTKQPWRGNPQTIADRLRKFVTKYGDYSDDEFVEAARHYVKDNINSPYMRILLYFIYKNVDGERRVIDGRLVGDRDKISPLADYLNNREESEAAGIDWDVELR